MTWRYFLVEGYFCGRCDACKHNDELLCKGQDGFLYYEIIDPLRKPMRYRIMVWIIEAFLTLEEWYESLRHRSR